MTERARGGVAAPPRREREEAAPVRSLLLVLICLGIAGLGVELFLLEHTESAWQWAPFVVLGAGLASGAALALRPGPGTVRAFQAVMTAFILTGLVGLYLHFQGNRAFELEMDPAARGVGLVWRALRGATPALAPGALVQLGLLGLVAAHRHPALRRSGADYPKERR